MERSPSWGYLRIASMSEFLHRGKSCTRRPVMLQNRSHHKHGGRVPEIPNRTNSKAAAISKLGWCWSHAPHFEVCDWSRGLLPKNWAVSKQNCRAIAFGSCYNPTSRYKSRLAKFGDHLNLEVCVRHSRDIRENRTSQFTGSCCPGTVMRRSSPL